MYKIKTIISFILLIILIFVILIFINYKQHNLSKENAICYLTMLGNEYFKNKEYVLLVNFNLFLSKFPNKGVGYLHNFNSSILFGDSSLANSIAVFIFNNSYLAKKMFYNNSILESYFTYEINESLISNNTINFSNIIIKKFVFQTKLTSYNNTNITFYTYTDAFVYNNILFLGVFENSSIESNLTYNLISLFKNNTC